MTRPLRLLSVGLAAIVAAGLSAQTTVSTGNTHVAYITVTRQDGQVPIADLNKSSIQVRYDGAPVVVRNVSRASAPLTAVVLLDTTWTTTMMLAPFIVDEGVRITQIPHGAPIEGKWPPNRPIDLYLEPLRGGLFRGLRDGDRVRFGTIERGLRLDAAFASGRATLDAEARKALNVPDQDRYGPSPIWDAVDNAVAALETEEGHRAVVLVTDGFSTGNRRGLADVARRAALAPAAVYIVHELQLVPGIQGRLQDLTSDPWIMVSPLSGPAPKDTLRELADTTGGAYLTDPQPDGKGPKFAAPSRELARRLEAILKLIHQTYLLTFDAPSHDGAVHTLEVSVADPGLRVRAPKIYRSPL
jgi:hypothetical protein